MSHLEARRAKIHVESTSMPIAKLILPLYRPGTLVLYPSAVIQRKSAVECAGRQVNWHEKAIMAKLIPIQSSPRGSRSSTSRSPEPCLLAGHLRASADQRHHGNDPCRIGSMQLTTSSLNGRRLWAQLVLGKGYCDPKTSSSLSPTLLFLLG
jgi:hypothetical protein